MLSRNTDMVLEYEDLHHAKIQSECGLECFGGGRTRSTSRFERCSMMHLCKTKQNCHPEFISEGVNVFLLLSACHSEFVLLLSMTPTPKMQVQGDKILQFKQGKYNFNQNIFISEVA